MVGKKFQQKKQMKHLIIGYGNMGSRYKEILESLGETVEAVDLLFEPTEYRQSHDSILVCTPPDNHYLMIDSLPRMPIFCEKPLITIPWHGSNVLAQGRKEPSLVSVPWMFCKCIQKFDQYGQFKISCFYPSGCRFRNLDLIHFYTLFRTLYPKPNWEATYNNSNFWKDTGWIKANWDHIWDVSIHFDKIKRTTVNGEEIHKKPCDMFVTMMRHWLEVIKGKSSIMPFDESVKLNLELLEGLDKFGIEVYNEPGNDRKDSKSG